MKSLTLGVLSLFMRWFTVPVVMLVLLVFSALQTGPVSLFSALAAMVLYVAWGYVITRDVDDFEMEGSA